MAMSAEEKKKRQLEANRRYRAKVGCYSEAQKQAIYKYFNKKREDEGKTPIKPRIKKEEVLDFQI